MSRDKFGAKTCILDFQAFQPHTNYVSNIFLFQVITQVFSPWVFRNELASLPTSNEPSAYATITCMSLPLINIL